MENQLIIYPEFDERIERDYLYHVPMTSRLNALASRR